MIKERETERLRVSGCCGVCMHKNQLWDEEDFRCIVSQAEWLVWWRGKKPRARR